MVVKIYISGISGNKEVKKRQQRVLMILDSKSIKYELIDITEPGREDDKEFMQSNSKSNGGTVSDPNPRSPLPPQLFNDDEYCGDYDQFDLANEVDTLEQYLKLEVPPEETPQVETEKETVTNGDVEKNESKETSPVREDDADNKAEAEDGGDGDKAKETKETDAGDNAEETDVDKNAEDTKDEPAADKKSSRETSPTEKVSSKEPSPAKDEEENEANESEKEASPERQSVEKEVSPERQSVEKEEPKVEKEQSPSNDVESEPKQSKEPTPEKEDVSVNENGTVSSREQSEEKESAPESKKDNPSEALIESEQVAAAE